MDYHIISDPWISQSIFNFVYRESKYMRFEFYAGWNMDCNCNINKQYGPVNYDEPNHKHNTERYFEHEISKGCTFRTFMNKLCKVSKSFSYYRLSSDYILSNIINLEIIYDAKHYNTQNKYDKLCEIKHWNTHFNTQNKYEMLCEIKHWNTHFNTQNEYDKLCEIKHWDTHFNNCYTHCIHTLFSFMKSHIYSYKSVYYSLDDLLCIKNKIPNISKIELQRIKYPVLNQLNRLFLMLQNNNKLFIIDSEYISLFNDNEDIVSEQLILAKNYVYFYCDEKLYYWLYSDYHKKRLDILRKNFNIFINIFG